MCGNREWFRSSDNISGLYSGTIYSLHVSQGASLYCFLYADKFFLFASCTSLTKIKMVRTKPRGGALPYMAKTGVFAAQRGMVFRLLRLKQGIHFHYLAS